MRLRWMKGFAGLALLALSALFYGTYYTSLAETRRGHQGPIHNYLSTKNLDGTLRPSDIITEQERRGDLKHVTRASSHAATPVNSLPTCPTSLRLRVQNDSIFGKLFNFDTPLLQWDSHMTGRIWQNLSQRPVPYGWKDLPRQDISSTLKLLSASANRIMFDFHPPRGCVRCAVVGNGGILNGSRKGKEIDEHDYVFRLNGAVIKGFEADVGTKTSFYGFTVNTMKNSLIAYQEYGFTETPKGEGLRYIFIPSDLRDYIMLRSGILGVPVPDGYDKGDKPSDYFGPQASPNKFKFLHPEFLMYIRDRFLKSEVLKSQYANLYMPSTGGLMLFTALHSCDQVSAYGFITQNYNLFSDHYYEREKKPLEFYANHDMIMEMQLWRRLHDKGIMQLYQRRDAKS